MSATRLNVNQGETYTCTVQWTDTDGVAIDLTGATAKLQLKTKPGGTTLHTFTSSPLAGLVITALTGTVALTITAAQSAAWTFNRANYDLLLTLSDGTKKRLLEGDLYVSSQVTV